MWGRAGARRGAAQGRSVGLRRGGGGTACTLGGGGAVATLLHPSTAPCRAHARPRAAPLRSPTLLRPCPAPCCAPALPHTAAPLRRTALRSFAAPRCAPTQPHATPLRSVVDGCAREGDGGAVSSAAERHRAADRAEERPGLAIVGRGARRARGVGEAAVSGGARTPLGGDESRRASSRGANPGGGGGERHAVPSRPNRTRTGPAGGIPGGRAGLGTGAPGPGCLVVVGRRGGDWAGLWAAAGEVVVEGPGGFGGEPREAPGGWTRAPEGGRSLRGGGGGLLPARAAQGRSVVRCRGAAVWGGAGVRHGAAEERGVGPRMGAAWGRAGARRGAAQGRSAGRRMGAAWGRAGAQ